MDFQKTSEFPHFLKFLENEIVVLLYPDVLVILYKTYISCNRHDNHVIAKIRTLVRRVIRPLKHFLEKLKSGGNQAFEK